MPLTGFHVVHESRGIEDVAIHCWDGDSLVVGLVTKAAIRGAVAGVGAFDSNICEVVVSRNLGTLGRMINAKYASGKVRWSSERHESCCVPITSADVEESPEKLSVDVLNFAD